MDNTACSQNCVLQESTVLKIITITYTNFLVWGKSLYC